MKSYSGSFESGDGRAKEVVAGGSYETTYTFIRAGDEFIRNVSIFEGLDGVFRNAVVRGELNEIYVHNGVVVALKLKSGKIFATEFRGSAVASTIMFLLALALIIPLITFPLALGLAKGAGIGLRESKLKDAVKTLPNVQFV